MDKASKISTYLSLGEWAWKLGALLYVGATAIAAAYGINTSSTLQDLPFFYWAAIIMTAILIGTLTVYLFMSAMRQRATASLYEDFKAKPKPINPLSDHFADSILRIEDLYLPSLSLHTGKTFRNCRIVGPGSVALIGSTMTGNTLKGCGTIIPFPAKSYITGVPILENCHIANCHFIGITILSTAEIADILNSLPHIE